MPETDQLKPLQDKFSLPGRLRFEPGTGGLIRAAINTPLAEAHIYLHGAHVTHYQLRGQSPLLFLSKQSFFQNDKAIRGGIPICLPWFAAHPENPAAPMHGLARIKQWTVESTAAADDGSVQMVLTWASDADLAKWFPHPFRAKYTVTVGAELRLALEVYNTGQQPMRFTEALHTYFQVADVKKVRVEGLEATDYLDKVLNFQKANQGSTPITFAGETDRIYLNTRSTCVAHDVAGHRNISIAKDNSLTTVVWNPWSARAKALADFGDDEWQQMLCIETCNVADYAITLAPNQSHTMTAVIKSTQAT
jgi:glucose-6-phosphate 1-epimerase